MTFDLSLLRDGGISWLDASGPESAVVLSTRVRLARNLHGYSFTVRTSDEDRAAILDQVLTAREHSDQLAEATTFRLNDLDLPDRQLLHERHLVSKELAGLESGKAMRTHAAVITDGHLGVMVNEEDHVRLQVLRSGFSLTEAYSDLERLDADLGSRLSFAFHPEFLTSESE